MTMSAPLPAQDSLPMELPLTSSPGASRAKTYQLPESSAAWAKAPVPASGPRLSDLLATYDRATSSWRTSQHCLLAQVNGEADGLAEFSETWPSAGMMRNGKTYRRQPWALPIAESVVTLLGTPRKSMWGKCWRRPAPRGNLEETLGELGLTGWINPLFVEQMMGFPDGHTDLQPLEMP